MEWRQIPGLEDRYEVSDTGLVRNMQTGTVRKTKVRGRDAYPSFIVFHEGRAKQYYLHKVVMAAFVGPRPKGFEICHWDGDKANCSLNNLRYGTKQDNWTDRKRLEEHPKRYKTKFKPEPCRPGWKPVEYD